MIVKSASQPRKKLSRKSVGLVFSVTLTGAVLCLLSLQRELLSSSRRSLEEDTPLATPSQTSPRISKTIQLGTPRPPTEKDVQPQRLSPMTFRDLQNHYQCQRFFRDANEQGTRPTNHTDIWNRMWHIYLELGLQLEEEEEEEVEDVVTGMATNLRRRFMEEHDRDVGIHDRGGMQVPYRVAQIGNKGLGLKATTHISRGSLVFDGRPRRGPPQPQPAAGAVGGGGRAILDSGEAFRRFLDRLEQPQQNPWNLLPCMALQCTAVESTTYPDTSTRSDTAATPAAARQNAPTAEDFFDMEDPSESSSVDSADYAAFAQGAFLAVDVQDACFANDADTDAEFNVGSLQEATAHGVDRCDGSPLCDYAVRDIQAGEELAWDYNAYLWGGWEKFGL